MQTPINNNTNAWVIQHQAWLNDDVTKLCKAKLDAHEAKISTLIAECAMDVDKSDYLVRLAVQLKTIKTIKQLLYDTKTFTA